ncbi:MAG: hypothetical protein KY469_06405 [Actinobacteria bacterium]|nr:hypothetical protein [Actinomycetota bacterium]
MTRRRGDGSWAWLARVTLVGIALLSACSDEPNGGAEPGATTPAPVATTAESTATPSPSPEPTSEVEAAYRAYLDATVEAMSTGDPDSPGLRDLARDRALTAAQARVANLTSQGRIARGAFVPAIQSLEVDDDSARLLDCYRADIVEYDRDSSEEVADRDGVRFAASAELRKQEGDWVVVDFAEDDFCVPEDLAADIESSYLAFWDAVETASRPPDPDHPALAATAGGEQLEGLRQRLAEFRDEGYEVRGHNTPNPLAVQITSDDTVALVRDCRELDPEAGVYDAETGERIQGGAEPGERSLWESRMELRGGAWKVVDADLIEEESTCDPASF